MDVSTLCNGFVGCHEGLPASLWNLPVVRSGGGIGLEEWSCGSFWEFGKGFLGDGGLAGCAGSERMKGARATEDEGHVTGEGL